MLKNDNRLRVLKVFFDYPYRDGSGFLLRELSRALNLGPPSVKRYLSELEESNLIIVKKNKSLNYPTYHANRNNEYFKFLKQNDLIKRINEAGLLNEIIREIMPDAIFLFGSASLGEDIEGSDLDLFVCGKEKKNRLKYV